MMREFYEEIGRGDSLSCFDAWRQFARMTSERSIVDCFAQECNRLPRDYGFNDRGEELVTVHLSEIAHRRDAIRNLKWLLPLAFDDPQHQFVTAEFVG